MEILNNCAGIATLILFIIYFIGRIITIFSVRNIWRDEIVYKRGRLLSPTVNIVDNVGGSEEDDLRGAYLISHEGIRNLKVYEVELLKNDNSLYKKGKIIYSRKFVNVNETVDICFEIGETIPTIIVEYLSSDYMRVTIEWVMNAKCGVASEYIQPKHTLKSFLYYLFR